MEEVKEEKQEAVEEKQEAVEEKQEAVEEKQEVAETKKKYNDKITCECGKTLSKQNIAKHKRTACKLNKQPATAVSTIQVVDVMPQQIQDSNDEVEQPKAKVKSKAKAKASTREVVEQEPLVIAESAEESESNEEVHQPPLKKATTKRQINKKVKTEPLAKGTEVASDAYGASDEPIAEPSARRRDERAAPVLTRVDKLRNLAKQGLP